MASDDIQYIKGIGEKRAEFFRKLGINTACALLRFYPRDYRDYKNTVKLFDALPDSVCAVKCKIVSDIKEHKIRNNMTVFSFYASDGTGLLCVKIFNNKYAAQKLSYGKVCIFYGKITGNGSDRAMSSPEIVDEADARITPIYSLTAGLYQSNVRKAVKSAFGFMPPEIIPDAVRRRLMLCDIDFAIRQIHFPDNFQSLETAKRRLIFEELFLFRIGVNVLRQRNSSSAGMRLERLYEDEFQSLLPFTLTDSQTNVIRECAEDMLSGKQMNRLVQGDVGSGKTAIAAALMYSAAKSGMQCVMMAPTEILAEQHFRTVSKFFENSGIRVVLLTGAVKKSEKQKIKEALKSGEADIVIGTQALIRGDVEFSKLGLVVADEQHRFGVAQRAALLSKGERPHMLVMSATPIPRTLALILYGDLDISTVDSRPSGRQPISTYAVKTSYRERIYNFIKKNLDEGRQAYIVCPLVEENDTDITPAQQYFEKLSKGEFSGYKTGLLHGKMKPSGKDEIMRAFLSGDIQLLVSTTVIEVGVDVPNANIIVIENAERFGLSQLHQLRGRVGRGEHKSHCILVTDAENKEAKLRCETMCKTNDGFKISEQDLKLRGPGDFMGHRQHGLPEFRIADLNCDMEELKLAGKAAEWVLSRDPGLSAPENAELRKEVLELFYKRQNELN